MEELDTWTMDEFFSYYEKLTKKEDGGQDLTTYCATFFIHSGGKQMVAEIWNTRNRKIQLPVHMRVRIMR